MQIVVQNGTASVEESATDCHVGEEDGVQVKLSRFLLSHVEHLHAEVHASIVFVLDPALAKICPVYLNQEGLDDKEYAGTWARENQRKEKESAEASTSRRR